MKLTRRISLFSVLFLLCLALSACSRNESIVGMWEVNMDAETKTIGFKDDGAYTVTNDNGDVEEEGTFIVEGNRIIFTSAYNVDGDTRKNLQEDSEDIMTFSINGRMLTVTTKDGNSMDLTRKR